MSFFSYTPLDWYWQVGGDDSKFWSSARLNFFPPDDAQFIDWLSTGNVPTNINSINDLLGVMNDQVLQAWFALGIQVNSSGTPTINGTYSLAVGDVGVIQVAASDEASGLGLPDGSDTFLYYDINGYPVNLPETTVINFYKAVRNYKSSFVKAVAARLHGTNTALPTQPVTIA